MSNMTIFNFSDFAGNYPTLTEISNIPEKGLNLTRFMLDMVAVTIVRDINSIHINDSLATLLSGDGAPKEIVECDFIVEELASFALDLYTTMLKRGTLPLQNEDEYLTCEVSNGFDIYMKVNR